MSLLEDFKTSRQDVSGLDDALVDDRIYTEEDEAAACEDVRRLARALAPQMSDLEDVLREFSSDDATNALDITESANRTMEEEDDDMDDELHQLAMSEQALREELEFAQDMSNKFSGPYSPSEGDSLDAPKDAFSILEPSMNHLETTSNSVDPPIEHLEIVDPVDNEPPDTYTLQDHADHLQLQTEKAGGWYYCDMTRFFSTEGTQSKDLVKDYCLPIPFRKLKRLYSGLFYHQVVHKTVAATPSKILRSPTTPARTPALDSERSILTPITPASSKRPPIVPTPGTATSVSTPAPPPLPMPQEEPLPVRTVAIQIRPDVLCGAVMDAVHHAFEVLPNNSTTHVLKRQGGHLRGAVYIPGKGLGYIVDTQLCMQKNDALERRLIVRFYHVQDDPEALNELGQAIKQRVPQSPAIEVAPGEDNENTANLATTRHMKQACSLIQRLMAAQQQGGVRKMDSRQQASWLGLGGTIFKTKHAMQKAVGNHLESNFKACPSVREENKKATPTIRRLTLPSLSKKDMFLLNESWTLTSCILEELDTRDCTFNTLSTLPFGQFPCLPTLDVQYCSQLRRLSRESMITQLLKAAKDLEDYAKTAEYNCAVCITLLEPMLKYYGIPPLNLPNTSKSLQDYPLDYTPPQVSCPPWGSLVTEALNKVAAQTPTGDVDVTRATQMVYEAFTRQDDGEQAARLGRKNAQIMDRLANMQAHQRALVQNIRDAHVYSSNASKDADKFLKRAIQSVNAGKEGFPSELQPDVPLLSFRISVGASTSGTCYVSPKQIQFRTALIPLVGGSKTTIFDLTQIEFVVDESVGSTLLNPFPNTMSVVVKGSKKCVYNFRPSIGPTRLYKFLSIIQGFASEELPSEFSQVVENVELVDEAGMTRLSDPPPEDQLSI